MITTRNQPGARAPFVLLVNPWTTDFAAFDLWARPLGLLLHDNSCFACRRPGFGYDDLVALKQQARRARRELAGI